VIVGHSTDLPNIQNGSVVVTSGAGTTTVERSNSDDLIKSLGGLAAAAAVAPVHGISRGRRREHQQT
jgi:hypothetical protein